MLNLNDFFLVDEIYKQKCNLLYREASLLFFSFFFFFTSMSLMEILCFNGW